MYDGTVSMELLEDKKNRFVCAGIDHALFPPIRRLDSMKKKNRFIHAGADLGDIGILVHPPGCAKTPVGAPTQISQ